MARPIHVQLDLTLFDELCVNHAEQLRKEVDLGLRDILLQFFGHLALELILLLLVITMVVVLHKANEVLVLDHFLFVLDIVVLVDFQVLEVEFEADHELRPEVLADVEDALLQALALSVEGEREGD